jgi:hypothetical protein
VEFEKLDPEYAALGSAARGVDPESLPPKKRQTRRP